MRLEPGKLLQEIQNISNQKAALELDSQLDRHFGIPQNQQLQTQIYSDLSNEALSTSYKDYLTILQNASRRKGFLIDLGAGFCRGTLLANYLNLPVSCISVECEEERVSHAKTKYPQQVIEADIFSSDFKLPAGSSSLFLYMPAGLLFARVFELLTELNKQVDLYVIESHGQMIATLDVFEKWFTKKSCIGETSVERHDRGIYRYSFEHIRPAPEDQNILNLLLAGLTDKWELRVHDPHGVWVAPLEGCEIFPHCKKLLLELKIPNRLLDLDQTNFEVIPKSAYALKYQKLPEGAIKVYSEPAMFEFIDGSFKNI